MYLSSLCCMHYYVRCREARILIFILFYYFKAVDSKIKARIEL